MLAVKSRPSKISAQFRLKGKHLTLNVNLSRNWLSKRKLSVRFKSTHIFSSIFGILSSLKVVSSLPHKALFCSPSQQFSLFPLPLTPNPLNVTKEFASGMRFCLLSFSPKLYFRDDFEIPCKCALIIGYLWYNFKYNCAVIAAISAGKI